MTAMTTSLSRRAVLTGMLGLGAGAGTLASCAPGGRPVGAAQVLATEAARPRSGRTRTFVVQAARTQVDLAGTVVDTWAYSGSVPGPALRATAGDQIRVDFRNLLPQETSVHWHGLAIRNDMDGVPHLTSDPVAPGGRFAFDFVVPDAGTHWFHPHTGLQLDRGLYAPFIVDDPHDPGGYDAEWVVVLDDWTDGIGPSPETILAGLRNGSGSTTGSGSMMGSGSMGGMSDGGDVTYPLFLVNGRAPADPDVLRARPGQRVRLRVINAAADTVFDVAVGGHRLQVTHSDGYPVRPAATSALRIGMGERYDAIVTLGKAGTARALIRTGGGNPPPAQSPLAELDTTPLTVADLTAAAGAALPVGEPDSTQDLVLAGSMSDYVWTINGRTYDRTQPLVARPGRTTRLRIRNHSMMSHPVHVHGHTFQLGAAGSTGPRKDTLLVPPMSGADVDLRADNPGRWMVHCHNAYHAEAGMMTRLDYRI
jgi:FtsP/CotA-like multicopper oxidase with cupredoxin domain